MLNIRLIYIYYQYIVSVMTNYATNKSPTTAKGIKLHYVLHELIASLNMNLTEFAKALDMPYPTLHQLIKDEFTIPKVTTLRPIAKYFNITIDQLIGDAPLPTNKDTSTIYKAPHESRVVIQDILLFTDCAHVVTELLNSSNNTTLSDALNIIRELYLFSSSKKLKRADKDFAAWYFNRSTN